MPEELFLPPPQFFIFSPSCSNSLKAADGALRAAGISLERFSNSRLKGQWCVCVYVCLCACVCAQHHPQQDTEADDC